jgi:hypothetical protein
MPVSRLVPIRRLVAATAIAGLAGVGLPVAAFAAPAAPVVPLEDSGILAMPGGRTTPLVVGALGGSLGVAPSDEVQEVIARPKHTPFAVPNPFVRSNPFTRTN